jgi:hypothetical protein
MPWVSVYVDIENETILEEVALRTKPCTIPRWEFGATMYGKQYGYSPAVVYGTPDGRMMQQIMLSLLEASEKATNPPMIAVGEAINGAVNVYASGITQVDADYDERTGEMLRPMTLQLDGIQFGAEQLQGARPTSKDAFYLSKIRFPEITKEMTAFEASKLWDEFIRQSLPLWEPVQAEYNGACATAPSRTCSTTARSARSMTCRRSCAAATSPGASTPRSRWRPRRRSRVLSDHAADDHRGRPGRPEGGADRQRAARGAQGQRGAGVEADWLRSEDEFKKLVADKAAAGCGGPAGRQVAHGADVATKVASAAESAGNAAQLAAGRGHRMKQPSARAPRPPAASIRGSTASSSCARSRWSRRWPPSIRRRSRSASSGSAASMP